MKGSLRAANERALQPVYTGDTSTFPQHRRAIAIDRQHLGSELLAGFTVGIEVANSERISQSRTYCCDPRHVKLHVDKWVWKQVWKPACLTETMTIGPCSATGHFSNSTGHKQLGLFRLRLVAVECLEA